MPSTRVDFKVSLGNDSNQSLGRKRVKLYSVSNSNSNSNPNHKPELLCRFTTHKDRFTLRVPTQKYTLFYMVVTLNAHDGITSDKISLLTIFSSKATTIRLNEQTTVATLFCFSRFFYTCGTKLLLKLAKQPGKHFQCLLRGCKRLLHLAYQMRNNFIADNGEISEVIASNPNGLETNSYPLFNYLANMVYYCWANSALRSTFLTLSQGETVTLGMLNLAKYPFRHVAELYAVFESQPPLFVPSLNSLTLPSWKTSAIPTQWTLTLKFNRNGSDNFLIGGPGYVAFDQHDRVWINNNVRQGTPTSSTFCSILESNGQPASFSPLSGGGLLGAGFGIAANQKQNTIAIGNFGWGPTDYNPQHGSVSVIQSNGRFISPPHGFTHGVQRPQGVYYDVDDNLWMASWGSQKPLGAGGNTTFDFTSANSAVVVYMNSRPNNYAVYEFDTEFYGTFDVVADEEGNVYATNAGNKDENVPSSIYHFRLVNQQIVKQHSWVSTYNTTGFEAFRQVTVSPSGYVFVAAVASSRILKFDKQLNYLTDFTTNIDGPWGVIFNDTGTMFVSNFLHDTEVVDESSFDMKGNFGITVVYNEDDSTARLVTLPTGGDQVMLSNGFPLYGNAGKPSYEPLMRITGSKFDAMGNLWSVNNWKPALVKDLQGNPGGDGVVVFINLGSSQV